MLWVAWLLDSLPWEAITAVAAIAAVFVAIRVSNVQTREARQQHRRQAIADVHAACNVYSTVAGKMTGTLNRAGDGRSVDFAAQLGELTDAAVAVDKALTYARMTCTEPTLSEAIDSALTAHREYFATVSTGYLSRADSEPRAHFDEVIAEANEKMARFNAASGTIAARGRALYTLAPERARKSLRRGNF